MIQEAIIRYLRKHRQESLSPKAVLFDMDGVLYDSMRFHARAWHGGNHFDAGIETEHDPRSLCRNRPDLSGIPYTKIFG